jgi:HAD superfamily hydrolase (TIGR01509 family)
MMSDATRGVGMPELEAVLFDMDGTLVDSEKVWDVGLRELARRYGGELSAPARTRMIGTSMAESMDILHADIDQPWRDPYTSVTWLEARVRDLFASGLVWRPGARELLAEVRAAGIPSALVTATRRHLVEVALTTIGADNFDVVVCGDDVAQTKPHPEPYLTAAARLGVPPERCIAIEDSPTGVTSARRAGCVVVAVPCEVALTDPAGVIMVDSLELLDVPTLRGFVADQAAA